MTGLLGSNELDGMLKEATVAKFEILSQQSPGGTKENHENPVTMTGIRAKVLLYIQHMNSHTSHSS
jgi:hypothetical protein